MSHIPTRNFTHSLCRPLQFTPGVDGHRDTARNRTLLLQAHALVTDIVPSSPADRNPDLFPYSMLFRPAIDCNSNFS